MKLLSKFFFLILLAISLVYGYEDTDLDGIEDVFDECPNTLITDLVDINGCTVHSLKSPHSFSILVGEGYSQVDNLESFSTSLQMDYYYKAYSLQFSSSYISLQESIGDTYLSAYYTLIPSNELKIQFGFGLILPTYNSGITNNLDYIVSVSGSYNIDFANIFMGYSYTIVNDEDSIVTFQNTNAYNLGIGFYPTKKLYSSLSYGDTQNTYKTLNNLSNLTLYNFYSINESLFLVLSYEYRLGDNGGNEAMVKLGYYF